MRRACCATPSPLRKGDGAGCGGAVRSRAHCAALSPVGTHYWAHSCRDLAGLVGQLHQLAKVSRARTGKCSQTTRLVDAGAPHGGSLPTDSPPAMTPAISPPGSLRVAAEESSCLSVGTLGKLSDKLASDLCTGASPKRVLLSPPVLWYNAQQCTEPWRGLIAALRWTTSGALSICPRGDEAR